MKLQEIVDTTGKVIKYFSFTVLAAAVISSVNCSKEKVVQPELQPATQQKTYSVFIDNDELYTEQGREFLKALIGNEIKVNYGPASQINGKRVEKIPLDYLFNGNPEDGELTSDGKSVIFVDGNNGLIALDAYNKSQKIKAFETYENKEVHNLIDQYLK